MAHKNSLSSKSSNFFAGLADKESLNYGNAADIQGCVAGAIIDTFFIANKIRGNNRIFIDIGFYTIVLPYTSSLPTLRKCRRKGMLDLSWVNVLF
jgi:hypothetical protein